MVLGDQALHGVIGRGIAMGISTKLSCQRQHAGMLARAVVVDIHRSSALADQGQARGLMIRPMGAALVKRLRIAGLGKDGAGNPQVIGLAIVRGTAERQLLLREAETVCRTAFDHGQALEGLDGGAGIDCRRDGALGRHDMARRIDHSEGPAMAALDDAAAGDFGDHGIGNQASMGLPCAARRRDTREERATCAMRKNPERPAIALGAVARSTCGEQPDDEAHQILGGEGHDEHREIDRRIGAARQLPPDARSKPGEGQHRHLAEGGDHASHAGNIRPSTRNTMNTCAAR
jgi:hypothetical protein